MLGFDVDVPNIIVSLIFSGVGFIYFRYGKKQTEIKLVLLGVVLMAYSYFVPNIYWNIGVGLALSGLPLVLR